MSAHEFRNDNDGRHRTCQGSAPGWARRATDARASEWSADRVVDEGDTHDKGELSLCVGEAA